MRELKQNVLAEVDMLRGRTPHGVRELKLSALSGMRRESLSRTPHGVRELKPGESYPTYTIGGRTPHGVRELKRSVNLE